MDDLGGLYTTPPLFLVQHPYSTNFLLYKTQQPSLGFRTIIAPVIPANNMGPQKVIPVILDFTWPSMVVAMPVENGRGAAVAPRNALMIGWFQDFHMMSRE